MPVPTSFQDFWELTLRINFSNVGQEGTSGMSLGWSEKYPFIGPGSYTNDPKVPPISQARTLIQARAALLGGNLNIVRNTLSLASYYRDRWPVGPVVTYPLTNMGDYSDPLNGVCNTLETALLYRFENNGQRYTHQIRGIRDRWVSDEVLFAANRNFSYGPYNNTVVTGLTFDQGPLPAVMTATSTTGVNGVISFTNTAGILSAPVIATPGSGLQINGLSTGTFDDFVVQGATVLFTQQFPFYSPAFISITLTAGVITGVSLLQVNGPNTTYSGAVTFTLPVDTDPLTLQQYLYDRVYIDNFGSVVAQYCCWFNEGHVPKTNAAFAAYDAASLWPTGSSIPVANTTSPFSIVSNANGNMRFLVERVDARKTGRMYKNKRARKKVAR
jgi:hypothetical protein